MPTTITVFDESTSGEKLRHVEFEIPMETLTIRELIRSRVYQEVNDFNVRQATEPNVRYQGLVTPTEIEATLNGEVDRMIDWKRQVQRANDAFRVGQILILVDDRQVETLDETITVGADSKVSFLRLNLLAGG